MEETNQLSFNVQYFHSCETISNLQFGKLPKDFANGVQEVPVVLDPFDTILAVTIHPKLQKSIDNIFEKFNICFPNSKQDATIVKYIIFFIFGGVYTCFALFSDYVITNITFEALFTIHAIILLSNAIIMYSLNLSKHLTHITD